MVSLRVPPNAKKFKFVVALTVVLLGLPLAGYATLLAGNALSAWRISRILTGLEKIRVGDPPSAFLDTIRGCTIQRKDSQYFCQIVHFQLQFGWLEWAVSKLPEAWTLDDRLRRLGLRTQYLSVFATIDHQQIQSMSVMLIVDGRYESLGQRWEIAEYIPELYLDDPSITPEDRRTHMNWFHITSARSGEGFHIEATPSSSQEELKARHANPRCLFSFLGCDGLCELMPDAIPVLQRRKRGFGGCTSAPASHCELTYEVDCRRDLEK